MAGFAVKKSAGRRWIWCISTGLQFRKRACSEWWARAILHDGPVFRPWVVLWVLVSILATGFSFSITYSESKGMPNNDISVFNIFSSRYRICHTTCLLLTLIRKLSTSPELAVFVPCDPYMVLRELGPLRHYAVRVGKKKLGSRWYELI
jgi:hypothetical protein